MMDAAVKKVLELVAEGKVSAKQGNQLLHKIAGDEPAKPQRLVIELGYEHSERLRFYLPLQPWSALKRNLPAELGLSAGLGDTHIDLSQIEWKLILDLAASGEQGELFYLELESANGLILLKISAE